MNKATKKTLTIVGIIICFLIFALIYVHRKSKINEIMGLMRFIKRAKSNPSGTDAGLGENKEVNI